jgi:nucleotide-binding universal stress UspA family protein
MPPNAVPHRILVAIDPEPEARSAVAAATGLALALHAELVLLAFCDVAVPTDPQLDPVFDPEIVRRQELLDRLSRERLQAAAEVVPDGVAVRTALSWGPAGPATVEAAREHDADLIVVPMRHDQGPLGRLVHDHADRHVLHHAGVPVLVVPTRVDD